MPEPKVFRAESDGQTLIVTPLTNVSSLADESVKPELDGLLEQLERPGVKNAVVDFADISYFGTTMLETMRVIGRRVRDGKGKMVLCNLSNMEREILRVAGFDTLWPICESREEALQILAE